jgi:ATP-dependent helicase/nuclease subunit B
LPTELIPRRISASAYQRLINCPYQYFSADGLSLKPLEELSEELKKADYGERIHTILQTFHSGHREFGKPFAHTLSDENREQAEEYLSDLSTRIFLSDLENNVLHRSWLHRWKKHIPAYISWQIRQQKDWTFYLGEEYLESPLSPDPDSETVHDTDDGISIYGRLDRIDTDNNSGLHEIIDYKTGTVAKQDEIDAGENVQLSMYAMLDPQAEEVAYLSVDSSQQKVETRSSLSGEDLVNNREKNRQRLIEIFDQIDNSETLHSWGDETVCGYCDFSGLCRKASWSEHKP